MAKAIKQSKNARTGVKTQKFYHFCGGEIQMRSVFANGKLKHFAQCTSCKAIGKKPSSMK